MGNARRNLIGKLLIASFFILFLPSGAWADVYVYDPSVSLSWSANPEPDMQGYEIHRSISFDGPYAKAHGGIINETFWTDTNLGTGSRYYYRLCAVDLCGNMSALSAPSEAVLVSDGDFDGDGMPDTWEQQYPECLDPLMNDAGGDCDGDGFLNLDEYLGGSSPTIISLTLTMNASPSEGGTVTGAGAYDIGEVATIQAHPNLGWEFDRWEGDDVADSNNNPEFITLDFNKSVAAVFVHVPGTYYVPDDYPTIQAALDARWDGDTIIVRNGIYTGADNKNLDFGGKAITLRSKNGPHKCIIDCEGDGRGFHFHSGETSDSVVDGFTIVNGNNVDSGGGILCIFSSPDIKNCIISENSADFGGGIYCWGASPTITNCTIADNLAEWNGGGIVSKYASSPIITNSTITGNSAGLYGGAIYRDSAFLTATNCIIWGNSPTEIEAWGGDATYSNLRGNYPGDGNINSDPLFVQSGCWAGGTWVKGDYHLTADSPCIDAGTVAGAPNHDIDDEARPQGNHPDIGADEYSDEYFDVSLTIIPDRTTVSGGEKLGYTVTVINHTDSSTTFEYWTNLTLPDGNSYPQSGRFFPPHAVTLGPFATRSEYITHNIRRSAPLGSYKYNAYIGEYPISMNRRHFDLEVVEHR